MKIQKKRSSFGRYLEQSKQAADRRAEEEVLRGKREFEEYLDYLKKSKKQQEEEKISIGNERESAAIEDNASNNKSNQSKNTNESKSEYKEKSGSFAEFMDRYGKKDEFDPINFIKEKQEENITVPLKPGLKRSDIVSYSAQEQRDFFTKSILAEASLLYDGKINELKQKRQLQEQQNRLAIYNQDQQHGSDVQRHNYIDLDEIDYQIQKLEKEKETYIQTGLSLSDPKKLFSGQLNNVATNSDEFLKLSTTEKTLRSVATDLKNAEPFSWRDLNLVKETNLADAGGSKQYKKAVSDYFSAKLKLDSLLENYTKLSEYINMLGYLPKTLEEIPEQYRSAAKSMFTVNGKFLLEDKKFRDDFNAKNVVEKNQLENITKIAKNVATTEHKLDKDYIWRKKEEIDLAEKYYQMNNDGNMIESAINFGKFRSARRILENAERHQQLNEAVLSHKNDPTGILNFGTAIKNFFWNDAKNAYTFGSFDAADAMNTYFASKNLKSGQPLSIADKTLLETNLIENAFRLQYGDYKRVNSYNWSYEAAESLQFMAEFMATAGIGAALEKGAAKGVSKFGGKALLKNVTKNTEVLKGAIDDVSGQLSPEILKQYALTTVAKYGNAAAYKLYQAAGRLGADAAYAVYLANTLGMPKTAADALKDASGNVVGGFDINGNPYVDDIQNDKDLFSAVIKSETRNIIENFSEMMGEWGIGTALAKSSKLVGLGNFMKKIENGYKRNLVKDIQQVSENYLKHGTSELNAVLRKSGLSKFIPRTDQIFNQRILKAGRFNGFFGEVSEEYYGLMLQHLFGVQDDPNKNLWEDVKAQSADIFGGIAVSTGLLGAFSMGHAGYQQMKYDNAVQNLHNLFGKDAAFEIQKSLTFAHPIDFYNTLDGLMDIYGEGEPRSAVQKVKDLFGESSLDKKTALAEYAQALFNLRGAVYGEEAVSRMMDRNTRVLVRDAKKNGYGRANYHTLMAMNNVVNVLEKDADTAFPEPVKKIMDDYGNNITDVINGINDGSIAINQDETKQSAIEKFIAYINATNFREGVDNGLRDMADERAKKSASLAFKIANNESGTIRILYRPKLNNDGTETGKYDTLYWIDGNLSKDDTKILVADKNGIYEYLDRNKLEGWRLEPEELDMQNMYNMLYLDAIENQWKIREKYLSQLGENPKLGDTIRVGNQVLTILDANPRNGITYSLSDDEDGTNSKIYHAEDVQNLQQFIDQSNKDVFDDITEVFRNFAKDDAARAVDPTRNMDPDNIVKRAILANKTRKDILDKQNLREANKFSYSEDDEISDEELQRNKDRQITAARFNREIDLADVSDEMTDEEIERNKERETIDARLNREFDLAGISDEMTDEEIEQNKKKYAEAEEKKRLEEVRKLPRDYDSEEMTDEEIERNKAMYAGMLQNQAGGSQQEGGETPDEDQKRLEEERRIKEELEKAKAEEEIRRAAYEDELRRQRAAEGAPSEEVKKLEDEIAQSHVSKIATTGYHYIIEKDGRRHLSKRVHSIIGDRLDSSKSSKKRQEKTEEYKKRLLGAEDIFKETETILVEIYEADKAVKEYNGEEMAFVDGKWLSVADLRDRERRANLNIDAYKDYFEQYPNEKNDIIEGISHTLTNRVSQTVIPGNLYDVIARYYLDYRCKELKYDDPRLTTRLYGNVTHIGTPLKYKSNDGKEEERPLVTEEAFYAICKELQKIKTYYEALGWKLICEDGYTLSAEVLVDGNRQWVAGETDCIAIDDRGRRILIDFKTYKLSSKRFFDSVTSAGIESSEFFNRYTHREASKDDLREEDNSVSVLFSNATQYARQLAAYKILAASNDFYFLSANALLFGIDYAFIGGTCVSIQEDPNQEGLKHVSHSALVIKDLDGKEVPNLVNLDNKADQDPDVKKWVADLEQHVKTIKAERIGRLKQFVEDAEISIDFENSPEIYNDLKEQINQYNQDIQQIKKKLETDPDNVSDDAVENCLSRKRYIEDLIQKAVDEYHRKEEEKQRIIKQVEDIHSYESAEDGLYDQLITTKAWIGSLITNRNAGINTDEIDSETINEIRDQLIMLGIWIKFVNLISPQSETLKEASSLYQWALKNIFNVTTASNIQEAVKNNRISYNEEETEELFKRKDWFEVTGFISDAKKYDGKNVATSVGNKGTKLTDVTNKLDFVESAEFYVQRSPEHANDTKPQFEIVVVYNGEEFSPVVMNFDHTTDEHGKVHLSQLASDLYNDLCNRTKQDKTARIKLRNSAISRTPGGIKNTDSLQKLNIDFFNKWFNGKIKSWSDIVYSRNSFDFGLTKNEVIGGVPYVVVKVPGHEKGQGRTIYTYTGRNKSTTPPKGCVVFMYTPQYNEIRSNSRNEDEVQRVPINLISPNFDNKSAKLILDILLGKHAKHEEGAKLLDILQEDFIQNPDNPKSERLPLTNMQVLRLFISFGRSYRDGKKQPISINVEQDGKITIAGNFDSHPAEINADGSLSVYSQTFDLNDETEQTRFVEFLQSDVRMQIDEDIMSETFDESSTSIPGNEIIKWFKSTGNTKMMAGDVELFESSDFEKESRIGGLAWYIKNGRLLSSFDGMRHPLISIDEGNAVNANPEEIQPEEGPTNPEGEEETPTLNGITNAALEEFAASLGQESSQYTESVYDKFDKNLPSTTKSKMQMLDSTIDEAEARRRIKELVGDIYIPPFADEVLGTIGDSQIAGACHLYMIRLSKRAKRGTEYHEAFHRILELLIPDKQREKAYKEYRKKFGQDLSDNDITEKAADEFWWYKENKPMRFKFSWNLKNMYDQLTRWYRFLTKIGSFTLWRLYSSAANGAYANNKPSAEAIARWNRLTSQYGYLASIYETDGMKFDHIMNSKEYRAVQNTIRMIVLDSDTYKGQNSGQVFDLTGKDLDKVHLTENMVRLAAINMMRNPTYNISEQAKLKLLEALGVGMVNGKIKVVNNNLHYFLENVIKDLKQFQVSGSVPKIKETKDDSKRRSQKSRLDKIISNDEFDEWTLTLERSMGEYEKVSSEFEPITRATPRVKFFFSVIDDMESVPVRIKDKDGKETIVMRTKYRLNAAGLPQCLDPKSAWNFMLNRLYSCRTQYELYHRLGQLGKNDKRFKPLFKKYKDLLEEAYIKGPNGEIFKDIDGTVWGVKDRNKEGIAIEIVSTINHAKIPPHVMQYMSKSKEADLSKSIQPVDVSMEYSVVNIRQTWSDQLASGENQYIGKTDDGKYYLKVKRGTMEGVAKWFTQFSNLFSRESSIYNGRDTKMIVIKFTDDSGQDITIPRDQIDLNNEFHLYELRKLFVSKLNSLGINVTIDDFDYILQYMYGGVDLEGMRQFFEVNGKHINGGFRERIEKIGDVGSAIMATDNAIPTLWSNSKTGSKEKWNWFLDELSRGMYYRKADEEQTRYLTIGGKSQYAMSEPDFITDRVYDITQKESETRTQLLQNPYYNSSLFLTWCDNTADKDPRELEYVRFSPMPGLKTDAIGSEGVEYLDLSEQEDIVAKYGMLASDEIIMPTLSDKTTYGGIKHYSPLLYKRWTLSKLGLGIDYTSLGNDVIGQIREFLGEDRYKSTSSEKISLRFNNKVLDQFIAYAQSEYDSAKQELARIDYETKHPDSKSSRVNNLDNGTKVTITTTINGEEVKTTHIVHQCARLATFTGIISEDGSFISFNKLYNPDGSYCTEAQNLENAKKAFFDLDKDAKRTIMARVLSQLVQKELKYLEKQGMIEFVDGLWKNKGLDRVKNARIQWAMSGDKSRTSYQSSGQLHNDALIAYVADMVCRQQISMQESFRIFSVDPRSFNWNYNEDGFLYDSTQDLFKRLGGLVSTGTHNTEDVNGIKKDIICAEINDTKYESDLFKTFKEKAIKQELIRQIKDVLFVMHTDESTGQRVAITLDNENSYIEFVQQTLKRLKDMSIDQLEKELIDNIVLQRTEELNKDSIAVSDAVNNTIREQAIQRVGEIKNVIDIQTNAFSKDKLNVTDGATFVTDEFCEDLLHILGKWDDDIAEAFRILREADDHDAKKRIEGDKKSKQKYYTNEDIRNLAEAYNKIYTTVIGTQKYTAYGYRLQPSKYIDDNGNIVEYDRIITFYDKTAYFPIFNCMASGHMKAILKKMKDQGVQVLKMSSAIKAGGIEAQQCDYDAFDSWDENEQTYKDFKFNTYTQPLSSIRKQFNTDPKGKEYMPLGTQYVKVLLSLLDTGQDYTINGEKMTAVQVREQVMDAINKIADAGYKEHMAKFYTNGELDLEKFLDILKRQLEDKDANDQLLKSLIIEKDPITKKKRFHMPIAAMSSTQWIESIVTSVVNKEIVDINTPGQAFYQRSAWGMEGKMRANYINEDDWEYTINHGEKLQEINENGSMDCVLSIDFFDYLFEPHPELRNQSFVAKKNWLIKQGIISGFANKEEAFKIKNGDVYIDPKTKEVVTVKEDSKDIGREITAIKWHNAKANIVGYRIPTQAVSSIHAMRCVDVICAVRDTVILPREITAVTGSDFDIDKFFLSTMYYKYQYKKDSDEEIKQIFDEVAKIANGIYGYEITTEDELDKAMSWAREQGNEDFRKKLFPFKDRLSNLWQDGYLDSEYNDDENGYEHNANKLLKYQISLLCTTGNNISQLHGAIDADTVPLKKIANKIRAKYGKKPLMPFEMTSMETNVTAKMSFAIGKKGIGPYALNNNNHVFTMLYGVKFVHDSKSILGLLDLEDLSRRVDRNGHSILSWLSGLINAHVDVAKDPYIRSLGVNQYTYNLVSLLIRTGYGRETFWFTTQPIMNRLYKAYDFASGVYGDQDENRSVYTRTKEAVEEEFIKYMNEAFGTKDGYKTSKYKDGVIEQFKRYLKETRGIDINTAIQLVMKYGNGVKVLEQISCAKEQDLDNDTLYNVGAGDVRTMLSYAEIQAIVGIAHFALQEKAESLSTLVQYTKIDTKKQGTTISEQSAYMNKFEELLDQHKSAFEYTAINNMLTNSFIKKKTELAINATKALMSAQLIQATKGYANLESIVRDRLNISRNDEKVNTSIMKMIIGKIKADYFFTGRNSYCIRRAIIPEKLLNGPTSIYSQLMKIKDGLSDPNNHEYDCIRDKNGMCNNYLINSLIRHRVSDTDSLLEDADYRTQTNLEDEWLNSKFVKLQSFTEDAIKSTAISDAWDDLLNNSESNTLRRFAEELVVYTYMTAAATGGKYDLSKFVPVSWATGECLQLRYAMDQQNDTFAAYISQVLEDLNEGKDLAWSEDEISEMILNFSYDDNIVPTLKQSRVDNTEAFYEDIRHEKNPLIFGAISSTSESNAYTTYEENKHPMYIKVRSRGQSLSGQGKYDIYECVAIAQNASTSGSVKKYPIYAMVAPSGGVYVGGQRIFSIGIQEKPNKEANFRNYWIDSIKQLLNIVPGSEQMNSPKELMNELLYMSTNSEYDGPSIKQLIKPVPNTETLFELIQGATDYSIINGDSIFNSYQAYKAARAKSPGEEIRQVDYYTESTMLNLQDRQPEVSDEDTKYYTPMDEAEGIAIFGEQIVEHIRGQKYNMHVEFYKLHHNINGNEFYNPVMTISFKYRKNMGFAQLNADVDLDTHKPNGEYSVHFKTYVLKAKKDTKWASVQMSNGNKRRLMGCVIAAIPEGGKLSTYGHLSKGGVHALQHMYEYVDKDSGYIKQVGTRQLTLKSDGSNIDVPIWEKGAQYEGLYKRKEGYDPENLPENEPEAIGTSGTTESAKPYEYFRSRLEDKLKKILKEYYENGGNSLGQYKYVIHQLTTIVNNDVQLRNSIKSADPADLQFGDLGYYMPHIQFGLQQSAAAKSTTDECNKKNFVI